MPRLNHRWINPPQRPSPHLSIRTCANCKLQKHSHHESEDGREVHFTTFHRPDGTRVRGQGTPECTGYVPARKHPLHESAAIARHMEAAIARHIEIEIAHFAQHQELQIFEIRAFWSDDRYRVGYHTESSKQAIFFEIPASATEINDRWLIYRRQFQPGREQDEGGTPALRKSA